MKKILKNTCWIIGLLCWAGLIGCSDDTDAPVINGSTVPLGVHVRTKAHTKAPVTSDNLPSGAQIGVTLRAETGASYDGCAFDNIRYQATDGEPQTWQAVTGEEIRLSTTLGKAYAYHPYRPNVEDITAIPVLASEQLDVMWSAPVSGLDDAHPDSEFMLQHLLTVVRIKVNRGTYTKTGTLQQVAVVGTSVGSAGTLNVFTGELSVTKTNEEIAVSTDVSIDDANSTDVMVLPVNAAGAIQLILTLDGKEYVADVASALLVAGKIFTYNLTFTTVGVELTSITVDEWGTPVDGGSHRVDMAQPVESIPLTGDGYFNLGFSASDDLVFEMKVQPNTTGDLCPFGSRYTANSQQCCVQITASGSSEDTNRYWRFAVDKVGYIYKLTTCVNNGIYWLKFAVNGYALDTNGSLTGWSNTAGTTYNAATRPLFLGALNDNGTPRQYFDGHIYYLKVYQRTGEDLNLVHHYVPYDAATLYDRATGKLLKKTNK